MITTDRNQLFKWITFTISIMALSVLISPPFPKHLICFLSIAIIVSIAKQFFLKAKYFGNNSRAIVLFCICLDVLLISLFYERWIHSSKLTYLSSIIGMKTTLFVVILSVCVGAIAFFALQQLLLLIYKKVNKHPLFKINALIMLLAFFQFLQMQYSSLRSYDLLFLYISPLNLLMSFCVLFVINYLASVISRKYGLIMMCVFFTGWCIANYYVIEFHGSPLFYSELASAQTAFAVIGGYKFTITFPILILIVCGILEIAAINIATVADISKKSFVQNGLFFCIVIFSVFWFNDQLNIEGTGWSWRVNIIYDGYVLSFARDMNIKAKPIRQPSDYDPDNLIYELPERSVSEDCPDVIVVLNETFCDLNYCTGIETDIDCFESFNEINDATIGNAVAPAVGGGTNISEFELMTSKSSYLLPDAAPNLYLDTEIVGRSYVDYFNALGYYTIGMHCGSSTNYSRNKVYPAMGFDEIYLGEEKYRYFNKNGNRNWLDSDNYRDLIEHYENSPSDSPRFMYLLTLQNHGGWEQNDDQLDTVHVIGDYGDLNDDLNEYYSSIRLSCDAFVELTEYFKNVDRHVVICMVGDHAPSFIVKLDNKSEYPDDLAQRVVPYIMWSNYDIQTDSYKEYANMTDLIPMLIDSVNLPNTAFTHTINKLHYQFPVRLKNGMIMNNAKDLTMYDDKDSKFEIINQYYCLEYNSLSKDEEYKEELFLPAVE